jgi:hypothetical protein
VPDAAGLWLGALRALVGAAAHEIRNPLNGVALNLEVLLTRSRRQGMPAEELTGFASAATDDLRKAISLVDALLEVNRLLPMPAQLTAALQPVAVMAEAVASARGGSLTVSFPDQLAPAVKLPGDAVRGALAAALLPGALAGAAMCCLVVYEPGEVIVSIETETMLASPPDDEAGAGIAACGIGLELAPHAIKLRFPRHEAAAR